MATTTRRAPRRKGTAAKAAARVPHLSTAERIERGRAARSEAPRSSHAEFEPARGRPDPLAVLERQAATRVPELVPIRYGRMLVSPFTFYRGAAMIMAHDLASTPRSGLTVQSCGDAHLSNFGLFASPERRLVFDLNDFDETLPGPWEWDVKRLAVSMLIAAMSNGYSVKRAGVDRPADRGRIPPGHGAVRGHGQPRRLVRAAGHRRARPGAGRAGQAPAAQAGRQDVRQGADARQHVGVLEADDGHERPRPHRRPVAADRADRCAR